jgi:hypothetical protein
VNPNSAAPRKRWARPDLAELPARASTEDAPSRGQRWLPQEIELLELSLDDDPAQMAALLGRTVKTVAWKMRQLRRAALLDQHQANMREHTKARLLAELL